MARTSTGLRSRFPPEQVRVAGEVSARLQGRFTPEQVCEVLSGGPAPVAELRTIAQALRTQDGAFMLGMRPVVTIDDAL